MIMIAVSGDAFEDQGWGAGVRQVTAPKHAYIKWGVNFFMLNSRRVLVGTPNTLGAGIR